MTYIYALLLSTLLLLGQYTPAGGGIVSPRGPHDLATDNFTRANGAVGLNWNILEDSGCSPQISSNQLTCTGGNGRVQFYGGVIWPADQYSQAAIVSIAGGSVGPAVRMVGNGYYYAATVGSFGTGSANVFILIDDNGSQSLLASTSTATVSANDVIQLSVAGSTLTCTNITTHTVLLTASDSTIPYGNPGMYIASGNVVDNWAGGGVAAGSRTTLATDSFVRANASTLGANWTCGVGTVCLQTVSNQVQSASAAHGKEYYTATSFPTNQFSMAQVLAASGDINGAIVRYQGTADTHYVGLVVTLGGPGACHVTIDKDVAGAPTVLNTDSSNCTVAANDFVMAMAIGSVIYYVDTTNGALLLSAFDASSPLSGGSPGWSLNPTGSTPSMTSWSGGSIVP